MSAVNLDALIPREDFEISGTSRSAQISTLTLQIRDLEPDSFFYPTVRKPDFQRETSDWEPERIRDFVTSFLDGDLIPAIILWNSGAHIFTIDGAHRLSALIAWVNDDYGDGRISEPFFEFNISDDQKKTAEDTRKLIKAAVGTYLDYKHAITNPGKANPSIADRANRLGSLALQLQWVAGDAAKAEASFFRINQQAVPINKTEIKLLLSRKKPDAVVARAIMRSGTGHKYWSKFGQPQQDEIEAIAKDIYQVLFTPPLQTPMKSLDIPVAGPNSSAQALPLILDLVDLVNEVKDSTKLADDSTGATTIKYLKNTRNLVYRIAGTDPSSLGLHPVVYFYSATGRFQPNTFLAVIDLMKDFERRHLFDKFSEIRRPFEEFLMAYKEFIPQFTSRYGSGLRSVDALKTFYQSLMECLLRNLTTEEILRYLQESKQFRFLASKIPEVFEGGSEFSREIKSAAFLRHALANPVRCAICGGLLHTKSITIDHIQRKQDGGKGVLDNAQLSHPYCNTTYKH